MPAEQPKPPRLAVLRDSSGSYNSVQTSASPSQSAIVHNEFRMRLATRLPSQLAAGQAFTIPIVVFFSQSTTEQPSVDDIWIFASLIDEHSGEQPQKDLLHGQRAASLYPMQGDSLELQDDFAYSSFTSLTVSASGRYRIRLTAIDMKGCVSLINVSWLRC